MSADNQTKKQTPEEKLKARFEIKIANLKKTIQDLKAEIPKEERDIYALLKTWTSNDKPLKLVWMLINAKQFKDGSWSVPSGSTDGKSYAIPADESSCPCKGFLVNHHCSHLKAIALRAQVNWGSSTIADEGFEPYGDDEDEIPF